MKLLQTIEGRIAYANARRKVTDPIKAMAHISLYSKDQDGDQLELHCRTIVSVGDDYIEVEGYGLIDRHDLRGIHPINF